MNKKLIIGVTLIAALTLSIAATMIGCNADPGRTEPQQTTAAETLGVSYPTLMTYEEYKKLSPALQQAYYETFPSPELYMQWFNAAVQAYNESAANENATESENEGQITQPTEAKNSGVGNTGTQSATVPTQSNTGSTGDTGSVGNTGSTETTPSDQPVVETPVTTEEASHLEGTATGGTGRPVIP